MEQKQYFASLPALEIGAQLKQKVRDFQEYVNTSGIYSLWNKSYSEYYSSGRDLGNITKDGEVGEYRKMHINHYRNLVLHIISMTMSQKPVFEAKAINTDYKTMLQTILANGLLDYYSRVSDVETHVVDSVENACIFGEGHILIRWDVSAGDIYLESKEGDTIMTGDIDIKSFMPADVIRDVSNDNFKSNEWFILREKVNRYDMARRYAKFANEIVDSAADDDLAYKALDFTDENKSDTTNDDLIHVYNFYHKKTACLPRGRQSIFLEDGTLIFDGDLQYNIFPVISIVPQQWRGTAFGYSYMYDLLPIQSALDGLYSSLVTNINAYGINNLKIPKGCDIEVEDITKGLRKIEYNATMGEIEVLQLLQIPPEIFKSLELFERLAETISGVNSTARGNPEASLKSGSALALVQSMAIQFSNALQREYASFWEDVGSAIVIILRDKAKSPRIAIIAGKMQRSYLKEFVGDDLADINRVIVDMGNPVTKTVAGRTQIAEDFLKSGFIKTPEQYMQVITTGRYDPMIEGDIAEMLLIKSENEKLMNGEKVPVIRTDNHAMHIQENKTVLSSPEARANPTLVEVVLDHISQHEAFSVPQVPPEQAQQGEPQLPQNGGASNSLMASAEQPPNMPNMPENPLTGNEYNNQTGGL